jgi:hypothetical protein
MEFIKEPRVMKLRFTSVFFTIIWLVCAGGAFCETQYAVSEFTEVEITLSEQFTLEDVYKLSMPPGDNLRISQDSKVVTVQLATGDVEKLIEKGLEVTVLRRLFLIEGSDVLRHSDDDEPSALASCSGTYAYASSSLNVYIPTNGDWGGSGVTISSAPAGVIVTCVDVGYTIQHYYWSWLYVELSDSDYYFTHSLFNDWYDGDGYITGTETGIATFNGRDVNQLWALWAKDEMYYGGGYIDSWWIKVYYLDSPYCLASGGCVEHITGVVVGSINNTGTGCSAYADYTNLSTTMQIGVGYPITITNGYPDTGDQCGIWVDWNQDYDFEDAGEQIAVSGGPATFTATITPPPGAALGDTRMRIRVMYTGTLSPCGSTDYGEVEDYTITVIPAVVPISISGYVKTAESVGIPDVSVTVTSGGGTVSTDTNGYYQTTVLSPWTGTITPARTLWSFAPSQRSYTGRTTDVTNADFTGTYTANPTPQISGYVTKTDGKGLKDVLVSADSGQSDATNSSGYYEFTVSSSGPIPEPWDGTVTPGKDYWEFNPVTIVYSDLSSDIADQNFTATYIGEPSPKISGYIRTPDGIGIKDVQVATYKGHEITTTDSDGFYEFTFSGPWSGCIMPSGDNWTFEPPHTIYSNVGSDIPDQNYTGTYACTMEGIGVRQRWTAIYNGPYNRDDKAHRVTADNRGNVYVAGISGEFSDEIAVIKYNSGSNEPVWIKSFGFGYGAHYHQVNDLAVDEGDNVYLAGKLRLRYSSDDDGITVKYDPNGVILWFRIYDGPAGGNDSFNALVVGNSGNVFVTGGSDGAGTDRDALTIKYDVNGVELWAERYNGPADGYDTARDITMDGLGNVFITGESAGVGTSADSITIKYDPNGDEVWVARYNCPENNGDGTDDIAIDDSGNIFVGGATDANYAGGATGIDYLVIKYDSEGNEVWVASYNGPADALDIPVEMGIDGAGSVYISGTSTDKFETYYNYLTVKYGPDSNEPIWVARFDGPNRSDNAEAMVVDDLGNVYVTGYSWGEGWPPPTFYDYLTVKYGPDSNEPLWTARYDRSGYGSSDWATDVAVDNMGNVYVTGYSPGSGTEDDFMTIKYSSCCLAADLDCSGSVDTNDLDELCRQWLWPELTADFVPLGGNGMVNFYDLAVFASAWDSNSTSPNWDPNCDIYPAGGDGFVDGDDLCEFVGQWLHSDEHSADIAPFPVGDGIVNWKDYIILAEQWQQEQ